MSFWIAILLGFVQGITEFLPISSSGHLMLVEKIFGVGVDVVFLNVLLHIATLLAVAWFYRTKILFMIKNPMCKMNKYLFVATIPAVAFVLIFGILFGDIFGSSEFVGVGFLVTAIFFAIAQIFASRNKKPELLNWKGVLTMGFSQALALFPGISRSGTTFAFGVVSGMDRNTTLDFSFLMSIPIIIASLVYEIVFANNISFSVIPWSAVIIAFVCAFFTALLGIKIMQKLVNKINFWWFVPYLIAAGLVIIIWL